MPKDLLEGRRQPRDLLEGRRSQVSPETKRSLVDVMLGRNLSPEQQAETDAWQAKLNAAPTGPSGAENLLQAMTFNRADDAARLVGAEGMADQINNNQRQFREEHPVGSMAYDVLGAGVTAAAGGAGLAAAAPRAAAALSPVGRNLLPRAARYAGAGAAQSGLYSSGEEGNTAEDVMRDMAIGGVVGGAVPLVGRAVQKGVGAVTPSKAGPRIKGSLDQMRKQAGTVRDDYGREASGLYQQIRQSGTVVAPPTVKRLRAEMLAAGGRPNPNLARATAGMQQRVDEVLDPRRPLDFERIHELRMEINAELRGNLEPNDERLLAAMRNKIDDFVGNPSTRDLMRGTPESVKLLKEADAIYAKKSKMDILQNIIDDADVKTGRYTQSGAANTVRQQAEKLYNQIKRGTFKGFSEEETEFVRRIAKGEDVGQVTRWLARLSPNGPVAQLAGFGSIATMGPAGALVPAAGFAAAELADRTAIGSLGKLASKTAYNAPLAPPGPKALSSALDKFLLASGAGSGTAVSQQAK